MTKEITLAALLSKWVDISDSDFANLLVQDLTLDSRHVNAGDTFVAINGHAIDGRRFIDSALEKGARSVIAEACTDFPHGSIRLTSGVPVVYLDDLSSLLSELAGRLYQNYSSQLIGVTGTNGKTTITQLMAQWLELVGHKASVMGTTGNGFLDALVAAENTTGNAVDIQRMLSELAAQGSSHTALEVSSHGLIQGRVKALSFDVGIFTNLSRDHLDYHGTMEEYGRVKQSLFTSHKCQRAVINVDDEVGAGWMSDLPHALAVSLKPQASYQKALWAVDVKYSEAGITLSFDGEYGQGTLSTPLIGEFNASNVLLAFGALLELGVDINKLINTAPKLVPVLGRMELFSAPNKAKVVVDYAHTPDALEKALLALRVHCSGKLWAIFGCGGDRDTGKRPMMAEIAERLADDIILTDDNPRSEDPAQIVSDMKAGLVNPSRAQVKHSRYDAIETALNNSHVDDIILLAGKGHENYQVMADATIHYSDRESAQTLLGLIK